VFDIDMHTCPNCGGGELKIIADILERPVIEKILTHLGLPSSTPNSDSDLISCHALNEINDLAAL
jgi:hypothetical protein